MTFTTARKFLFILAAWLTLAGPAGAFNIDTSNTTPTNVSGLWWNANESGWGATLTQQGNLVFMAMFTYDAQNNPVWYVAPQCAILNINPGSCSSDLFRVRGGRMPTTGWTGASVQSTRVGVMTINFTDNNNASMNFTIDGVGGFKSITRQIFNAAAPANPNQALTEQLVGGTWTFAYTILSTFTNRYSFSSVTPSSSTPGDFAAAGVDEFGDLVVGTYVSRDNRWAVLDTSVIIDRFYVFTFSDLNHVSGCYYQISPAGSSNLSQCYSMSGARSPPKIGLENRDDESLAREAAEGAQGPRETDPAIIQLYLQMKNQARPN
jgi:hypothetical protein